MNNSTVRNLVSWTEIVTIYAQFANTASVYADRPFVHIPAQATRDYVEGPVDITYGQAREQADALVEVYRNAGYGMGHRVALALDNRLDFLLHFLALNALGASIVPVNTGFTRAEMSYVLEHSDSVLAISLPEHRANLSAAVASLAAGMPVVSTEQLAAIPPADNEPAESQPVDETEAGLLYTSGTTGKPKGCMLSNYYFENLGHWYRDLGGYCQLEPGRERLITPLPLVHMNALACSTMGMLMSGGCIVQLDRFHASTWWDSVRDSQATCLHYLGVMQAILLNVQDAASDDFSAQIKFGFGAGVDPKHQERFEQRFGFPLIEGWAMTETGAAGCIMANVEPRHVGTRCFGKKPDYVDYRIVDNTSADVVPDVPGELLVRASGEDPRRGFFSGYYKNPEATAEAWAGGWFHTGDVVRLGADGSFHFVDRKKNVIRRSGENIAAVEVEGVLLQCPLVDNCAVAPVPDEIRGEEVMACVILSSDAESVEATAEQIFEHCAATLTYFKLPGYIALVDSLPTTSTQKIQRGEMKKRCQNLLDAGNAVDLRARKRPARDG